MKKKLSSDKRSSALKVVGVGAGIVVVAGAMGMSPGVIAAAVLGAALAIVFS